MERIKFTYNAAITDNGVGLPATLDFRQTESLGWQQICLLMEQLEGSVELFSPPGTRIVLTFTELTDRPRL